MPYFEVSAKTNEGIKQMFFNAIAELPLFAEVTDKKTLAKELEKENEGENKTDGLTDAEGSNRNQPELNVQDKKETPAAATKKCNC